MNIKYDWHCYFSIKDLSNYFLSVINLDVFNKIVVFQVDVAFDYFNHDSSRVIKGIP